MCLFCNLAIIIICAIILHPVPTQSFVFLPKATTATKKKHGGIVKANQLILFSTHSLNTAFEWLAEERYGDSAYKELSWMDPSSSSSQQQPTTTDNNAFFVNGKKDRKEEEGKPEKKKYSKDDEWILPLYPLGATYLPCRLNFTLNNVEPRNIRMALDLVKNIEETNNDDKNSSVHKNISGGVIDNGSDGITNNSIPSSGNNSSSSRNGTRVTMTHDNNYDRRFCVVLRASDTGRIASVGTVMRIMETEQHHNYNGDISRIVVTCCAEETVDILSIENPDAASYKNRVLLRSPEYLRARVRPRRREQQQIIEEEVTNSEEKEENNEATGSMIDDLIRAHDAVRYYYTEGEIGSSDLPPFARSKTALPRWTTANFLTPLDFWETANSWQTLCNTVREGRQLLLSADRNEIMIAAATSDAKEKGEPLSLPIHMEDLSPAVRRQIQEMEVVAQGKFIELQLDPCLDFQALLSMPSHQHRIQFLRRMVLRERERLERLREERRQQELEEEEGSLYFWNDGDDDDQNTQNKYPRRGAWFDE